LDSDETYSITLCERVAELFIGIGLDEHFDHSLAGRPGDGAVVAD